MHPKTHTPLKTSAMRGGKGMWESCNVHALAIPDTLETTNSATENHWYSMEWIYTMRYNVQLLLHSVLGDRTAGKPSLYVRGHASFMSSSQPRALLTYSCGWKGCSRLPGGWRDLSWRVSFSWTEWRSRVSLCLNQVWIPLYFDGSLLLLVGKRAEIMRDGTYVLIKACSSSKKRLKL